MKKARIIVTNNCPKNCEGCCNKDWKGTPPVVLDDLSILKEYDEIIITGGEPLLYPKKLKELMDVIWQGSDILQNYYLYATNSKVLRTNFNWLVDYFNGITLTLHERKDIVEFVKLNKSILNIDVVLNSLRLHVFDSLLINFPDNTDLMRWSVKQTHWIKDCPLSKDETLFILKEPFK